MCRVRLRCKCPCSQLTRGWLEAGEFWGRGVEDFECLVPVDAAECALDIQADECCPWSAGRGGTDFGDFVFGARWASSSELVLAGCDFDLRFGRGGDDSEGEFDEGFGAYNGSDGALVCGFRKGLASALDQMAVAHEGHVNLCPGGSPREEDVRAAWVGVSAGEMRVSPTARAWAGCSL